MKLTMLGTGNALVTECYNTCFALSDDRNHFLVDGGGGNGILKQLKAAGIDWRDIHDIFVTHKHMDHILGVMWVIRVIAQALKRGEYEGEVRIHNTFLCPYILTSPSYAPRFSACAITRITHMTPRM